MSRAKHWFEKAAIGGSLKAQYHLGTLYAQPGYLFCFRLVILISYAENNYFVANMWLEKAASNWHWDPSDESTLEAARLELRAVRKTILRLLNSQAPQQTSSAPSVQQVGQSFPPPPSLPPNTSLLPSFLRSRVNCVRRRKGKKAFCLSTF